MNTTRSNPPRLRQRSLKATALTTVLFTLFLSLVWPSARAGDNKPTSASAFCSTLQMPQRNKMAFYVYALGVQVYRWNGSNWVFVEPWAALFAESFPDESPFARPYSFENEN